MLTKRQLYLIKRNFLFWFSRKIDYPLVPPDVLQVNFTFRCNLKCKMCSMHDLLDSFKAKNRPHELEIPTMKKIIKEASEMGIRSVIFVGGEPFLEPRLFDLVSFADKCGIAGITVVTNGTLLSEEAVNKTFESRLGCLSVSIDAATEETFARIRGERVLGKIIENIETVNRKKAERQAFLPNIVSVCTVMDQNLEELIDVVELCKRLKIAKVMFQPVVRNNTDQRIVDFSSPVFIPEKRYALLDNMIDKLVEYKLSSPDNFSFIANSIGHIRLMKRYFRGQLKPQEIPCYAGFNRLQAVQEGKIYFCVNQNKNEAAFGDIKKDNLKNLWFSSQAGVCRKLIKKCSSPCLQWCAYRDEIIELSESRQKKRLFAR